MTVLPAALVDALELALDERPIGAEAIGGGMINQAAVVDLPSGRVFVKWNDRAPKRFFDYETDGLCRIRSTNTLRVPDVLAVHDRAIFGENSFIALEYIEPTPPHDSRRFAHTFAETLAALHRHPVPEGQRFGLNRHNYIGSLPQINESRTSWAAFYRDCRIVYQVGIAKLRGRLPAHREPLLMQVVERMEDLLTGMSDEPSLIHGDLWSGNFLAAGDAPVVFDPAVYYGHREVELAFIELFGGFPDGFIDAYRVAWPLDAGYERRRPLLQLYPLLVHLNLFGEAYGPQIDAVCRTYLDS